MDKKGFVEGIKEYIALLTVERRYSTAKSYKDAWHSFVRYRETEDIPYTDIKKGILDYTRQKTVCICFSQAFYPLFSIVCALFTL